MFQDISCKQVGLLVLENNSYFSDEDSKPSLNELYELMQKAMIMNQWII